MPPVSLTLVRAYYYRYTVPVPPPLGYDVTTALVFPDFWMEFLIFECDFHKMWCISDKLSIKCKIMVGMLHFRSLPYCFKAWRSYASPVFTDSRASQKQFCDLLRQKIPARLTFQRLSDQSKNTGSLKPENPAGRRSCLQEHCEWDENFFRVYSDARLIDASKQQHKA